MSWNVDEGPWFDNQIGTLTVDGRAATFTLERSYLDGEAARLETLLETSLTGDRDWPTLIARTRESAAR